MPKSLIKGILYSIFDEKIGPKALTWKPGDLPRGLLDRISIKSMNLSFGSTNSSRGIAFLPFPEDSIKGLVKIFKITNSSLRGGIGERTLVLLFDEKDDIVFYKYLPEFEKLLGEFSGRLMEIHDLEGEREASINILSDFQDRADELIEELRSSEQGGEGDSEFPEKDAVDIGKKKKMKFKVIVCGEPGVGKTSIVLRFTENAFRKTYIPTIGVNIMEKIVDVGDVRIEFVLWDIAGHVKFSLVRKHFYEGAMGQMFVFDLTRKGTFEKIANWHADVKKTLEGDVIGLLIGNKEDLKEEREVSRENLAILAKQLNLEFIETSALTGENIGSVFQKIGKKILESLNPI
ncbi:MAG: Rab family GTPase [Promethearchaeota archaeon]